MDINQHASYAGTFRPKRTDDLKPGVSEWIGVRLTWTAAWLITEEDGGPYVRSMGDVPYRVVSSGLGSSL